MGGGLEFSFGAALFKWGAGPGREIGVAGAVDKHLGLECLDSALARRVDDRDVPDAVLRDAADDGVEAHLRAGAEDEVVVERFSLSGSIGVQLTCSGFRCGIPAIVARSTFSAIP